MSYSINTAGRRMSFLVVIAFAFGLAPNASAQTGSCTPALGEAYLDINNVRARIFNNGNLFYRGEPHVYEVPKGGGANALFAGGFWVGGLVNGQLRVAESTYGPYEFWAGPIDEAGNPPSDCNAYDRIWKINRTDIQAFEAGGAPTPHLSSWPTGLGAPTLAPAAADGLDNNGDGVVDEEGEMKELHKELLSQPLSQRVNRVIDLAAGERPQMFGDQMLWWIMNDRGNSHNRSDTPPIGIEAHGLAFAFNQAGALGNTTFYKVNLFMKATQPLQEAYVSIFSDPDLGDFQDDYVGSDTTLGVGYVYNSDDFDGSAQGYGAAPPALGYDFFQGPIVPSVGDTAHVSGVPVPDFKNLAMTSFIYYNNTAGLNSDPSDGPDVYNFMRARWKDGRAILAYGDGLNVVGNPPTTTFMFPGNPVTGEFWSELNTDGAGSINPTGDRRFMLTSGPFTINPGDQQEIVYGIVWARGSSNLDSIDRMRSADAIAQSAFDAQFALPQPPSSPTLTATPADGKVYLEWTNDPVTSNNALDSYREFNPLVDRLSPDYTHDFYEFEGYRIYQYSGPQDQIGQVIATYDVANGVEEVIDDPDTDGFPEVTLRASDTGVQHAHVVQGLTNYKTYYFGVEALGYNPASLPKVFASPIARLSVVPAHTTSVASELSDEASGDRSEPDLVFAKVDGSGIGIATVTADVVNPSQVADCEYSVNFYSLPASKAAVYADPSLVNATVFDAQPVGGRSAAAAAKTPGGELTYDIFCGADKVFDGSATGQPAPLRDNVMVINGLEFSVRMPDPGMAQFLVVSNGAGPLDPPEIGAFAFNSNGFPFLDGADRPSDAQQVGGGHWGIHAGGSANGNFSTYMSRSLLGRAQGLSNLGIYDFEIRFTPECAATIDGTVTADDCLGWRAFQDGALMEIPFEVWRTGISTPDDPGDDLRLIPAINDVFEQMVFDIGDDHPVSGGGDDPYTDWIYFFLPDPEVAQTGEDGYFCFIDETCSYGEEIIARQVIVNWNGGVAPDVNQALPEPGTVFRYVTHKPAQPGVQYSFSTTDYAATAPSAELQKERLEDIGIVPNPYIGASAYEVSQLIDEVRFTNLPDVATIRVFTLNGTLLRTITKNSPGQRSLTWDLTTDNLLPLASGMYLIHVEVPGVGDHVIKFGVVKKRIQLNVF